MREISRYIRVRANADSKKEEVNILEPDLFEIFVREKAENNMANKRIRELLATKLLLPIGKIRILTGHKHKSKIFVVED